MDHQGNSLKYGLCFFIYLSFACYSHKRKLSFFYWEIKMFVLTHRGLFLSLLLRNRSTQKFQNNKMLQLLRNSTIILFGSFAHNDSDVSEQRCWILKSCMIRALISLINLCKEQLGSLTCPISRTLPLEAVNCFFSVLGGSLISSIYAQTHRLSNSTSL